MQRLPRSGNMRLPLPTPGRGRGAPGSGTAKWSPEEWRNNHAWIDASVASSLAGQEAGDDQLEIVTELEGSSDERSSISQGPPGDGDDASCATRECDEGDEGDDIEKIGMRMVEEAKSFFGPPPVKDQDRSGDGAVKIREEVGDAEMDKEGRQSPAVPTKEDAPPANGSGGPKRPDRMPDMTGKVITVSLEETLELTKETKGKKKRSKSDVPSDPDAYMTASPGGEPAGVEKEFSQLIRRLSLTKDGDGEDVARTGVREYYQPISGEGNATPRRQNGAIPQGGDEVYEADKRKSAYTYVTQGTDMSIVYEDRRQSEFTVDYTVDTGSKHGDTVPGDASKSQSQNTFLDLDASTADPAMVLGLNDSAHGTMDDDTKGTAEGYSGGDAKVKLLPSQQKVHGAHRAAGDEARIMSPHRTHQPLRSSLRRSSFKMEDIEKSTTPNRAEDNRGISWSTLIAMEKKTGSSERRKPKETNGEAFQWSGSCASHTTPESKTSHRSRSSRKSHQSKGSNKSSRSLRSSQRSTQSGRSLQSSQTSKRSVNSGNGVSWKDESNFSMGSSNKNPEHVQKQAKERFVRGLHYAKRGQYPVAHERFLIALRYRVMQRGPTHPDVAAAHEMLGHTNYVLSKKVDEEDDFVAVPVKLDKGKDDDEDKDDMLGWDVAVQDSGKRERKLEYLKKACKHYQTVLDILGASQTEDRSSETTSNTSLDAEGDGFDWSALADTYSELDGDSERDVKKPPGLGSVRAVEAIVARVRRKLDSLPETARSGGKTSYATTFLDFS